MYTQIPNALTVARFPLACAFVIFHLYGWPIIGLIAVILGCVTDWADGHLARLWRVESTFGRNVDPYADKFITWCLAFVVLTENGSLWLLLPVILVMFIYDVGLAIIRWVYGRRHIPTNSFAKWKTSGLMTSFIALYADKLLASPLGDSVAWCATGIAWIATWYSLRSAALYLRGYGWGHYIPRPLHLL